MKVYERAKTNVYKENTKDKVNQMVGSDLMI